MNQDLNWLFILSDQHRHDWLGLHGEVPVRTPTLDALATGGVVFNRAICTSPLCAPSRASLVCGKRPHRTGVPNNDFDLSPSNQSYLKLLRDSGYRVGAVGKTDLHKKTKWYGLDGWTSLCDQLGFTETVDCAGKWDAVESGWPEAKDPYMAYLHRQGLAEAHVADFMARRDSPAPAADPTPLDREHYCDDWIARHGIAMLHDFPRSAPWHLMVNFTGPHEPFDAPAELLHRYRDVEMPLPRGADRSLGARTVDEHVAVRRSYAAMIEGIDEHIGDFINAVDQRGELDRTVIVYSADHGEMLGEHGLWGKHVMYDPSVRIPLIVSGPHVNCAGKRANALVELPDVAATFLDMVGLPAPGDWDARSFLPLLQGDTEVHRSAQVAMLDEVTMICDGRFKLVVDDQAERLYDLITDPDEEVDVRTIHAEEAHRLSDLLRRELAA